MYEDPKRDENDSLYDEDTDYEDEYDTDSSDYIDEDEEDEAGCVPAIQRCGDSAKQGQGHSRYCKSICGKRI